MPVLNFDEILVPLNIGNAERLQVSVEKLSSSTTGLKIEKIDSNLNSFSARINQQQRIHFFIFEKFGKRFSVIFSLDLKHNYSVVLKKAKNQREVLLEHLENCDTKAELTNFFRVFPLSIEILYREDIHGHLTTIQFDKNQKKAVASVSPDRILFLNGIAGTGKSYICLSFLHEKFSQRDLAPRGVYLTKSRSLAQQQERIYNQFFIDEENSASQPTFMAYEDFLQAVIRIEDGKTFTSRADFNAWFKEDQKIIFSHFPKKPDPNVLMDLLEEEFHHIGGNYNNEWPRYQAAAFQECLFKEDLRKPVFQCYQTYLAYLERHHRISSERFMPTPELMAAIPKYDFILVDEAQQLTSNEANLLRAIANHLAYFGDSNQGRVIFRPQQLAPNNGLNIINLATNYRSPRQILQLGNVLLSMMDFFAGNQGKAVYSMEIPSSEGGSSEGHYQFFDSSSASLSRVQHALSEAQQQLFSTVVIVPNDRWVEEAKQKFPHTLVFTTDEVHGFEFDTVLLYGFFDEKMDEIADYLNKHGFDEQYSPKGHRHKHKEEAHGHFLYLRKMRRLFSALTRTKQNLMIIAENKNRFRQQWEKVTEKKYSNHSISSVALPLHREKGTSVAVIPDEITDQLVVLQELAIRLSSSQEEDSRKTRLWEKLGVATLEEQQRLGEVLSLPLAPNKKDTLLSLLVDPDFGLLHAKSILIQKKKSNTLAEALACYQTLYTKRPFTSAAISPELLAEGQLMIEGKSLLHHAVEAGEDHQIRALPHALILDENIFVELLLAAPDNN